MRRYVDIPFPPVPYVPRHGYPCDGWVKEEHLPHLGCAEFETSSDAFAGRWRESRRWLYAIDLFNAGYWWETHEVLEGLWNDVGKRSPAGRFLQGVIQSAAALLKHSTDEPIAARRLADEACAKFGDATAMFGVDAAKLLAELDCHLAGRAKTPLVIEIDIAIMED